jgi:hypothetical protein
MRPEAAMIGNAKNRPIALTFDDRKEALYLLYFQVLKGLFALRVAPRVELYTPGRLFNLCGKPLFFAHIFASLRLTVQELCTTQYRNKRCALLPVSTLTCADSRPEPRAEVFTTYTPAEVGGRTARAQPAAVACSRW